jgi:hypothetical protein
VTDVRRPGVSSAGIASKTEAARSKSSSESKNWITNEFWPFSVVEPDELAGKRDATTVELPWRSRQALLKRLVLRTDARETNSSSSAEQTPRLTKDDSPLVSVQERDAPSGLHKSFAQNHCLLLEPV